MSDTSAPPVVLGDAPTDEGDTITVAPVIVVAPPVEPEPEAEPEETAAEAAAEVAESVAFDAGVAIGALTERVGALEVIVYAEPDEIEEEEVEVEGEVEPEGETGPGEVEPERVEPTSKKTHWMFRSLKDWRS